MSLYIVDIHGDIEGDYEIIKKYEVPQTAPWCINCKEYDQEKHCCHRWSNAIRDTVEEMKQEYIERDVLDKIRAEIEELDYITFDGITKRRCLEIIDKYKAESEVKE